VSQSPISIGGFPLPSDAPQFLGVLAVHIAAAIWCVITGAIAMLSEKQPGRHPRFGTFYFWGLVVVFITMSILSAMRWAEDYILFVFGALSLGSAMVGRQAAPSRSMGRIRVHVVAMAASYIIEPSCVAKPSTHRLLVNSVCFRPSNYFSRTPTPPPVEGRTGPRRGGPRSLMSVIKAIASCARSRAS
jgi:hypothetical protein